MWIFVLKGLSNSVFEACVSTGSEVFLFHNALKLPNCIASVFTLTDDLPKKFRQKRCLRMQEVLFRLKYIAHETLSLVFNCFFLSGLLLAIPIHLGRLLTIFP